MAARTDITVGIDADVVTLLRARAAEADVTEGEIIERALLAFDLRQLVAEVRAGSDLTEEQAGELVAEELRAARADRGRAA